MSTKENHLPVLTIGLLVLGLGIAGESRAYDPDRDKPFTFGGSVSGTVDGNPLGDGDLVFDLRASYRLLSGRFGFEGSFGYAEPSDEMLKEEAGGADLELLLADFSFVWFVNYSKQKDIWQGESPVKYEIILFGGPGWASLRAKNFIDHPRFSTGQQDLFTVNAGLGVNLYWFSDDPERHTSHWHLRPEIRGRWFGSGEDSFDWGVGLLLGYGFGNRTSCDALDLQVTETLKFLPQYNDDRFKGTDADTYKTARQHLDDLVDLKARLALYGPKCPQLIGQVDEKIRQLNVELGTLRATVSESGE